MRLLQLKKMWNPIKSKVWPHYEISLCVIFQNPRVVFKAFSIWASRSHYSSPEKFSLGSWHFDRGRRLGTMSSMSFALGRGLQAAQREEEREVGVVLCPNGPSWTDKLIASACFDNRGEFNGRTERQTFSRTRWGQRWMVQRPQASSGQRVQLLISDPHWPIDWLWGISHQLNSGHSFLLQPWPTGKVLSAFMRVPLYGDGWTSRQICCQWQSYVSVSDKLERSSWCLGHNFNSFFYLLEFSFSFFWWHLWSWQVVSLEFDI